MTDAKSVHETSFSLLRCKMSFKMLDELLLCACEPLYMAINLIILARAASSVQSQKQKNINDCRPNR